MLTQGRASLEGNQYIIMCSVWAAMAQNQADWELDKVENRMVKAGQADRGCTLAGKGVEALATSWVSEPFLMKLPCPGMSSDRQVVVCGGGGGGWLFGFSLWRIHCCIYGGQDSGAASRPPRSPSQIHPTWVPAAQMIFLKCRYNHFISLLKAVLGKQHGG